MSKTTAEILKKAKANEKFILEIASFLGSSMAVYGGATIGKDADTYLEVNMKEARRLYVRACRLTGRKP